MDKIYFVLYVYAFIIGMVIASFINVVIYRVPNQISVAKGRSFCPNCHHTLNFLDLFPLISWILLRGKCRYCGCSISKRYPLIEMVGGYLAVLCFYRFDLTWMTIISFAISMILLAITMIDFDTMTIPNGLTISLMIPTIMVFILQPEYSLINRIIGMLSISLGMILFILLVPGSFGGGDVKLMFVAGFMLGWQNTLLATFIGILIAGVYAIYLLSTKKNKRSDHIAFGPYLSIGIFISLLYGSQMIDAYLSLFRF